MLKTGIRKKTSVALLLLGAVKMLLFIVAVLLSGALSYNPEGRENTIKSRDKYLRGKFELLESTVCI